MESEQKFGLNRAAKIRAEQQATKENLTSLLIQPDFPYVSQPFDPVFFGIGEAAGPSEDLTAPKV
jgi:hypothetical protein